MRCPTVVHKARIAKTKKDTSMIQLSTTSGQSPDTWKYPEPVVALVEDNIELREELTFGLTRLGFRVWAVESAAEFYQELSTRPCHVAVVDVGLPDEDGFSLSSRLRAVSAIGIIMLTGRGHLEDRVRGLQGGADAYLVKPVDLRELAAVISGVVRRTWLTPSPLPAPAEVSLGADWTLEAAERVLVAPRGAWRLRLTASEYAFMEHMLRSFRQVVSRAEAADAIDPTRPADFDLHRIDMLVSRLRRKAEEAQVELPLRAVRGRGYVFGRE